jgi:hypothetical protein
LARISSRWSSARTESIPNIARLLLDTEAVKYSLDTVCDDAGVDVLLHAQMVRAERDGDLSEETWHNAIQAAKHRSALSPVSTPPTCSPPVVPARRPTKP